MNRHRTPAFSKVKKGQWQTLLFAGLLFVAQIFFQLHGLGHLEEADHDENSKELCVLCILGSGLDDGRLLNIATSSFHNHSFQKIEYSYSYVENFSFNAFSVRAPPLISSIA